MVATGILETDEQEIYWEEWGRPDGIPALFLHGGPGSGAGTGYRRHFDPARFRAITMDQRGCGRSRPLADVALDRLHRNTTDALTRDIEALRKACGVDRWLVTGVSWGSTLALAYAQAHPERVTGVVLAAVTTTSRREVEWITDDMGRIFPDEWERFAGAVPRHEGERVIDAYRRAIVDEGLRDRAAAAWCRWEDVHVSLQPGASPDPRYRDEAFRRTFATLVIHYWANATLRDDSGVLRATERLRDTPVILIHGRHDISSPLDTAWQLHRRLPRSELVVIGDAGHGGTSMAEAMTAAVERLAFASAATR
jgi:proline iminopeptidase